MSKVSKVSEISTIFSFLCQNLLYDSGSLGYSMAFGVIIISIINITLAIKFSDVASLHFNSLGLAALMARLFKSFEFGNGSRMSDENLVILPKQKMVETSCKKC